MNNGDCADDVQLFKENDCDEESHEGPLKPPTSELETVEENIDSQLDSSSCEAAAELQTILPGPVNCSDYDDLIAATKKISVTTANEDTLHGLSISDPLAAKPGGASYFGQAANSSHESAPSYAYTSPSYSQMSSEMADIDLTRFQATPPVLVENSSPSRQSYLSENTSAPGNYIPERLENHKASPVLESDDPIWVAQTESPATYTNQSTSDEPTSSQALNCSSQPESTSAASHENSDKDVPIPSEAMSVLMDIPGPCEPEDLIEGIIFSANYLGTTQLPASQSGLKNARMLQAQEALNRIKVSEGDSQPSVSVDLFISTCKIKILDADNQQSMMSHSLRSISYIADIGDLLVIMAKPQNPKEDVAKDDESKQQKDPPKRSKVICHVLFSTDSHLIAESVGQCFSIAYQQFLLKNSIEPGNLSRSDFSQFLEAQEMYHDDLLHYSKKENTKEIWVEKKKGEIMGIAIVESGWGSIIPTVILANLQHSSPMEKNGKFSIGDQIMSINGTSLVGLPLQTCQSIIRGLRDQTLVKVNIVSCPPVVSVLIKRPNLQHQLGFSVQNGVICSLMRGGIAERGGVRVGHRIIEINHQSVVATPHDKIVQMLVTSVGEIQMKTMPSSMYRLLTGQEQPLFL